MRQSLRVLGFVVALSACGDDEGDGHHAGVESCDRITDACHDVDTGVGEISECHGTAHDVGTAEACEPIVTRCVSICEAAAADGGTAHGDGGEDHGDGGH